MVAPTISSPVCQEQLVEAGRLVAKAVEGCVSASQAATEDGQLLRGVGAAATAVTQALNELLQHVKAHATGAGPAGRYDQATDTILTVTENIFSSMGDAGKDTHPQEDKNPHQIPQAFGHSLANPITLSLKTQHSVAISTMHPLSQCLISKTSTSPSIKQKHEPSSALLKSILKTIPKVGE